MPVYAAAVARLEIPDLDDAVVTRLRESARQRGISLEDEVCRLLTEAMGLTREVFSKKAAALRAHQRPNRTRAVDLIREDRDR